MRPRTHLTDAQIVMARGMWAAGATRDEIAFAIGVTVDVFRARCGDQLRDLPARGRRASSGRRGIDPSICSRRSGRSSSAGIEPIRPLA